MKFVIVNIAGELVKEMLKLDIFLKVLNNGDWVVMCYK